MKTYLDRAKEWLHERSSRIDISPDSVTAFANHLDSQDDKNWSIAGDIITLDGVEFRRINPESPILYSKPETTSDRVQKQVGGAIKRMAHYSHSHCFMQKEPACGLGGNHCCLCDIVTKPSPAVPKCECDMPKPGAGVGNVWYCGKCNKPVMNTSPAVQEIEEMKHYTTDSDESFAFADSVLALANDIIDKLNELIRDRNSKNK